MVRFNTFTGREEEPLPDIKSFKIVRDVGFKFEIADQPGIFSYSIHYSDDGGITWKRTQIEVSPGVFEDELVQVSGTGTTYWIDDGSTTGVDPLSGSGRFYLIQAAESFLGKTGVEIAEGGSPVLTGNIFTNQNIQAVSGSAQMAANIFYNAQGTLPAETDGNKIADPMFADPEAQDYSIGDDMSCAWSRGAYLPAALKEALDHVSSGFGGKCVVEAVFTNGDLTGWRFVYENGTVEFYDRVGSLLKETTADGKVVRHVYAGQSIQTAVDQAAVGDTILVHAGTYHETVTLKSGVDLEGEDDQTTIIHGDFKTGTNVIVAKGNNRIENLTITGSAAYSGKASSALRVEGDNVKIRNNRIVDNKDYGVQIWSGENTLIEGNLFQATHVAVQLPKDTTVIRYNTFVANDIGINILGGAKCLVQSNIITGSTFSAIYEFSWPAYAAGEPSLGYAVVEDNIVYGNKWHATAYGSSTPPAIAQQLDGNLKADPRFTNSAVGDFTVPGDSPAYNHGAFLPEALSAALDRASQFNVSNTVRCSELDPILPDGTTVKAYVILYEDGSSETFWSNGQEFLDTTPPELVILSTVTLTNQSSYELRYTVDGVEHTEIRTLIEGENTLVLEVLDAVGNKSNKSFEVILDTVPPKIIVIQQDPEWTNLYIWQIWYTVDGIEKRCSFGVRETVPNEFELREIDEAGNETVLNFDVYFDNQPPEGSITLQGYPSADYFFDFPVTLDLSASDALSGVKQMRFSLDGGEVWTDWENYQTSRTLSPEEAQSLYDYFSSTAITFTVEFQDYAGNVRQASFTSTHDGELPQGTITINGGAAYTNDREVTLNLTASDSISGVRIIQIQVLNADGSVYSDTGLIPFVATQTVMLPEGDGGKMVIFGVCDWASCTSFSDTIILDTIAPEIVIDPATPAEITETVFTVHYTVDGVSHEITFENLAEGENTRTIIATDEAGNESSVNWTVTMHLLPAEIVMTSATSIEGETAQNYILTYTVDGNSTDANGNPYESNWMLGNGLNRLVVTGQDSYGRNFQQFFNVTWIAPAAPARPEVEPLPTAGVMSMTDESGFILKNLNGELIAIEKPGEYVMRELIFNEQGELTGGFMIFTDETEIFYADNKIAWIRDPRGNMSYYNADDTLSEFVDVNDQHYVYSYEYDTAGVLLQAVITSGSGEDLNVSIYDVLGKLKAIHKADGTVMNYVNGMLQSVLIPNQPEVVYDHTPGTIPGENAEDPDLDIVTVTLHGTAPDSFLQEIVYDSEGNILETQLQPQLVDVGGNELIREAEGKKIIFENGVPVKVYVTEWYAPNSEYPDVLEPRIVEQVYDFQSNLLGEFTGLQMNVNGTVQNFDSQGQLTSISVPEGGLLVGGENTQAVKEFVIEDGKIVAVILTDGTQVNVDPSQLEDNDGNIQDGTIVLPDQTTLTYAGGNLVRIVLENGLEYQVTKVEENGETRYEANLVSDASGLGSDVVRQFVYDGQMNLLQTQKVNDEVVNFTEYGIQTIQPACSSERPNDLECQIKQFYRYEDHVVVIQGPFSDRPADPDQIELYAGLTYSRSEYDLQGHPISIKTFEASESEGTPLTGTLTLVTFAYGKIRKIYECGLDEGVCDQEANEKTLYAYEFDSNGNEITVITDVESGEVRRYLDEKLLTITTAENVVTTYEYGTDGRISRSVMTWQGREQDSFTYEYDDVYDLKKVTDSKGVVRIYDADNVLVGIIQGSKEYKIYHFTQFNETTQENEERTAQELIRETKDDGITYYYQMGKVTKLEYPDGVDGGVGTVVSDIIQEENGEIFSAIITRPNGSVERIINGDQVEIVRTDGTILEYENGKLVKISDVYGHEWPCQFDGEEIILTADDGRTYRYDALGQLIQTTTPDPFYDWSDFSRSITASGDVHPDTTQSQFGGAAITFDGNGDYLSLSDSEDWDFGSENYTIDTWVKFDSFASPNDYQMIFNQNEGNGDTDLHFLYAKANSWVFGIKDSNVYRLQMVMNDTVATDTWYHIAIVRNGDQFTFYRNGVALQTGNYAGTIKNYAAPLEIGWDHSPVAASSYNGMSFKGQMDDFWISKGIARWTSDFTPSATMAQPDEDTTLLIRTNADAPVEVPPTQLDPSTFSLATLSFDELATTLEQTDPDQVSDPNMGRVVAHEPGQVTIELTSGVQLVYKDGKLWKEIDPATGNTREYAYEDNAVIVAEGGTIKYFNAAGEIFKFVDFSGTEYNVTLLKAGSQLLFYQLVSAAQSRMVMLGADGSVETVYENYVVVDKAPFEDDFQNIREYLGEAFFDIGQICLQSSVTIHPIASDASDSDHDVTMNGDMFMDVDNYKNEPASAYFDGENDYISLEDSEDWDLGAGNFTIDFWAEFDGVPQTGQLIGQWDTEDRSFLLEWNAEQKKMNFYVQIEGEITPRIFSFDWQASGGVWNHIALTRYGTDLRLFINGAQIGTKQTLSGTIHNAATQLKVGNTFKGWLDELRFSKDEARWTSDFDAEKTINLTDDKVKLWLFRKNIAGHTRIRLIESGSVDQLTGEQVSIQDGDEYWEYELGKLKTYINEDGQRQDFFYDSDEIVINEEGVTYYYTSEGCLTRYQFQDDEGLHTWELDPAQTHYTRHTVEDAVGFLYEEQFDDQGRVIQKTTREKIPEAELLGSGGTVVDDAKIDDDHMVGDGAMYFDGSGDYLEFPDSEAWNTGTQDFTVDFWFKAETFNDYPTLAIWDYENGSALSEVTLTSDGRIAGFFGPSVRNGDIYYHQAVNVYSEANTVTLNEWHHVAVVRDGTTVILFLDGQEIDREQWLYSATNTSNPLRIGTCRFESYVRDFKGYMDEFRISKGIARWTENFTPSTVSYTEDSNTSLLLHFDRYRYTTTTTTYTMDGTNHIVTVSDDAGILSRKTYDADDRLIKEETRELVENGGLTSLVTVYGDSSVDAKSEAFNDAAHFDGVGDYLLLNNSNDDVWDLGMEDFTIDYRANFDTLMGVQTQLCFYIDANNYMQITKTEDNKIKFYIVKSGVIQFSLQGITTVQANTWYDIALVRQGDVFYLFVNGTLNALSSYAGEAIAMSNKSVYIGKEKNSDQFFRGWLDEFRISVGTADWTSNFTPRATPYDEATHADLLLHFDRYRYATRTTDYSVPGVVKVEEDGVLVSLTETDSEGRVTHLKKLQEGGSYLEQRTDYTVETDEDDHFVANVATVTDQDGVVSITKTDAEGRVVYQKLRELVENNGLGDDLTAVGDVGLVEEPPVGDGTAGFFNGNADYVAVTDSTDFNFGTGDYDVEFFVDMSSISGITQYLFSRGTSNLNFALSYSNNTGTWSLYQANAARVNYVHPVTVNAWYHIRAQRVSGVTELYIDGVASGKSYAGSDNITATTPFYIWNVFNGTGGGSYTGYIKEFRVSDIARTVAVPTEQYTLDSNTKLLMHFDSSTEQPLSSAIHFDGAGDYLRVEDSSDFTHDTNPFTYECFFNTGSVSTTQTLFAKPAANDYAPIKLTIEASKLHLRASSNNSSWFIDGVGATTLASNTWYHVAVVRNGNVFTVYLNGVPDYSVTKTEGLFDSSDAFRIGMANGQPFAGEIREFRVSDTARYTSAFIPSLNGWEADGNTKLYIKGDEANGTPSGLIPSMTSDSGPSPYAASASSDRGTGLYDPFKAFDGDNSTFYLSTHYTTTGTLEIDLGEGNERIVTSYRALGATINAPKNWTFEGSNDGSSWDILDTQLGTALTSPMMFSFSNTTAYEYYRFNCTLNNGGDEWGLNYLQLYDADTDYISDSSIAPKVVSVFGDAGINYASDYRSSIFIDETGKQVYALGGAKLAPVAPIAETAAHFDGSGDYLSVSDGGDYDFGSGDFTIDAWVNFSDLNRMHTIASKYTDGGTGWIFDVNTSSNVMQLYYDGWHAPGITCSTPFQANQWYHVAVVRQGDLLYFFRDGILQGTVSVAGVTYNGASTPLKIGVYGTSDGYFKGSMNEVRISKGIARWTGDFILAVEPYTEDSSTSLLLHFNKYRYVEENTTYVTNSDATTTATTTDDEGILRIQTIDQSGAVIYEKVREEVENGGLGSDVTPVGDVHLIDASELGSGASAAYFDGAGDYLQSSSSTEWNFGQDDFTIDFWASFNSATGNQVLWSYQNSGNPDNHQLLRLRYSNGYLIFDNNVEYSGYTYINKSWTPTAGEWYHLALVRSGSTYELFVNGQSIGTNEQVNQGPSFNGSMRIGCQWDTVYQWGFNGSIDEFRISKGIARWTEDFTPSTAPYAEDSNTSLLLHFDKYRYTEHQYARSISQLPRSFNTSILNLDTRPPFTATSPDHPIIITETGNDFTWPAVATDLDAIPFSLNRLADDFEAGQTGLDEVVYSVFDTDGKLRYTQKMDQTLTTYENGKIRFVHDRYGRLVQSYEYDEDGNPVKITLHLMREEMPKKIEAARIKVEEQKVNALRLLAEQEQKAIKEIEAAFASARAQLQAQRQALEAQRYQKHCQQTMCWTHCETIEVPGVAVAIQQVDDALIDLNHREAQAYADLSTQITNAKMNVETETQKAFEEVDKQEAEFKRTIIQQEISSILFHYYRTILGRDPMEDEYQAWVNATDYDTGLDIAKLKSVLNGSEVLEYSDANDTAKTLNYSEEFQDRTASVDEIKAAVKAFLNDYKDKNTTGRAALADQELALPADLLVSLSADDIEKVIEWIDSRGLHFGQSAYIALEHLMAQGGVTYASLQAEGKDFDREILATKLILIDILIGVITPFEEGDLLISLYAMKYLAGYLGINTTGLKTDLDYLYAFYNANDHANAGHKIIAHIDGNHYVIVTDVYDEWDADLGCYVRKIKYIDPGAGAGGDVTKLNQDSVGHQVMVVTADEFNKVWEGVILALEATAQTIIDSHESDPNLLATPPPHILTNSELQKVRGSFFFFLIPFFIFIFSAISAAVTAVVAAVALVATVIAGAIAAVIGVIGAIAGAIAGLIQGAVFGIVAGLGQLAGTFLGFATTLLHAIPFVGPLLSGVVGAIGNLAIGFVSQLVALGSTALGAIAAKFSIGAVLGGLLLSGGLDQILVAVGVPAKIAHYISIGVQIVGSFIVGGLPLGLSALASIAVQEFGPALGLSPALTSALSIVAGALAGGVGSGFSADGGFWAGLKAAVPNIAGSFAQAGVILLGDAIGLDPRLTALIGLPVAASIGGIVSGIGTSQGIFDSIKNAVFSSQTLAGLVSVGASIGLDAIGAPSLLQSFIPSLLGQLIAGATSGTGSGSDPSAQQQGESLFNKIMNGIAKFGNGLTSAVGSVISFGTKVIEGIGSLTKAGFAKAVDFFSGLFDRPTQEAMYQTSGGLLQNYIETNAILNGETASVVFGGAEIVWNQSANSLSVIDATGTRTYGDVGIDASGRFWGNITIAESITDDLILSQSYSNGRLERIDGVSLNGDPLFAISGFSGEGVALTQSGMLQSGIFQNLTEGVAYGFDGGSISSISILRNGLTGAVDNISPDERLMFQVITDPLTQQAKIVYDIGQDVLNSFIDAGKLPPLSQWGADVGERLGNYLRGFDFRTNEEIIQDRTLKMEAAFAIAQDGDLIFGNGDTLVDYGVKAGDRSFSLGENRGFGTFVNHVGIIQTDSVTGQKYVVETNPGGFRRTKLEDFIARYRDFEINRPKPELEANLAANYLYNYIDPITNLAKPGAPPYDYLGLLGLGFNSSQATSSNPTALYCSSAVYNAFYNTRNGREIILPGVVADLRISPQDIWQARDDWDESLVEICQQEGKCE